MTGSTSAVGALKDYARAILDGNLGEVAIYGSGATLVGSDGVGNKCVRAQLLFACSVGEGFNYTCSE